MKLFNVFKEEVVLPIKEYTVEEIHSEFDSAEQKCIDECDNLLKSLNIPTETAIEVKANNLLSLGFRNSSIVKQANVIKENNSKLESIKKLTLSQINTIKELKFKYPFEKFITVDELNRICKKYDLMYASVTHYIKDVPKKNIDDMLKAKKLTKEDAERVGYKIINFEYWDEATNEYKNFINTNVLGKIFNFKSDDIDEYDFEKVIGNQFKGKKGSTYWFNKILCKKIDKSGLFIAAPKSHFDLTNLSQESEFGFFEVKEVEIKDPVVFEFCKNDIVRILTKWGDGNEKDYSEINNETLN